MDELMTFVIDDEYLWETWRLSSWGISATGWWRYPLLLVSDSRWLGGSCCWRIFRMACATFMECFRRFSIYFWRWALLNDFHLVGLWAHRMVWQFSWWWAPASVLEISCWWVLDDFSTHLDHEGFRMTCRLSNELLGVLRSSSCLQMNWWLSSMLMIAFMWCVECNRCLCSRLGG